MLMAQSDQSFELDTKVTVQWGPQNERLLFIDSKSFSMVHRIKIDCFGWYFWVSWGSNSLGSWHFAVSCLFLWYPKHVFYGDGPPDEAILSRDFKQRVRLIRGQLWIGWTPPWIDLTSDDWYRMIKTTRGKSFRWLWPIDDH